MSLRRAGQVAAFLLAVFSVMVVAAAPSGAHAALVSASPSPGATLPQAPGAVVLRFSEAVDRTTSTIAVTGAGERDATHGLTASVRGDARSIRRRLRLLRPGRYTVRWTSVSADDGHIETGSYTFAIGVAASTARHVDAGLFAGESTTTLIGRLVALSGLLLWGGLLIVASPARRSGVSAIRIESLERSATAAALLGGLVVVGDRLGRSSGALIGFGPGRVGQLDGVVLVAAAIGAWTTRRAAHPRHQRAAIGAAAIAIVAEVASGHAATGSVPIVKTGVLVVHLLAVGIWTAAIVTSLVSRRMRRTLHAMSPYAIGAAAAVFATGAVAAALEIGRVSALTTTSYGLLVLAKVSVFLGLIAAGLCHWRRRRSRSDAFRVRQPLRVEAFAAVTAIVLGAVLSGAPPPSPASFAATTNAASAAEIPGLKADDSVTLAGANGSLVVGLTVAPPRPGRVQARVQVLGTGSTDRVQTGQVTGSSPGRRPFAAVLHPVGSATFGGAFRIDGRGLWAIDVSLTTAQRHAHVAFSVPVPTPSGRADLAHALSAEGRLTSVQLHESILANTASRAVTADYVFRAPDTLAFTTNGTEEIDIGTRTFRRDRPEPAWIAQRTDAAITWPSPYFRQLWGPATTARVVGTGVVDGVASHIVAFARPDLPAWFRLWVGRDGLVRREEMLAEGHLMVHTYFAFDHARSIAAPAATGTGRVTRAPISG